MLSQDLGTFNKGLHHNVVGQSCFCWSHFMHSSSVFASPVVSGYFVQLSVPLVDTSRASSTPLPTSLVCFSGCLRPSSLVITVATPLMRMLPRDRFLSVSSVCHMQSWDGGILAFGIASALVYLFLRFIPDFGRHRHCRLLFSPAPEYLSDSHGAFCF
jgi:hypothetical protein